MLKYTLYNEKRWGSVDIIPCIYASWPDHLFGSKCEDEVVWILVNKQYFRYNLKVLN